jgi:antitoxin MazE
MRIQVSKWGNSLAVRLPQSLVSSLKLTEGTEIELQISRSGIVMTKAKPRYELSELVKGITRENCHGEYDW